MNATVLASYFSGFITNRTLVITIFYSSYCASIICLVIKLKRYKRPTEILGGFDYGYFYEQTLYTRAAIAIAINTSFVALVSNPNASSILILASSFMCIFVTWILVGSFKNNGHLDKG